MTNVYFEGTLVEVNIIVKREYQTFCFFNFQVKYINHNA